jgi:hypothetical protein
MRFLVPSLCGCGLVLGVAWAQTAQTTSSAGGGGNGGMHQLPVGQVYKDFIFPFFQNGVKTWALSAREAVGKTQNRAEAMDLKIEFYEDGKVTTTVTSPDADLFMNDRKMRTKNTVQVYRPDSVNPTMQATGQSCDFDMLTKKYLLRGNVKVILRNVDTNLTPSATVPPTGTAPSSPQAAVPASQAIAPTPIVPTTPPSAPIPPSPSDTSNAYTPTNTAPIAPVTP